MVEYAVLLGGVAIMLVIALQNVGGWVEGQLDPLSPAPVAAIGQGAGDVPPTQTASVDQDSGISATPAAPADAVAECPKGWDLITNVQAKKNGQDVDANNDGFICFKDIPGQGKGNTNQNANVKDNN